MVNDLRSELRALVDSLAESLAVDLQRIVERHAVLLVAERLGATLGPVAGPNGQSAPRRGRTTRAPSSPKSNGAGSGKVSRRAGSGRVNRARILEYLLAHPGERSETVRASLGIRADAWALATSRLVREGKVSRKGEGSRATLHPADSW